MSKSVVVIEFDESNTFKSILDQIKDLFNDLDVDKIHIYAAVDRSAEEVLNIVQVK